MLLYEWKCQIFPFFPFELFPFEQSSFVECIQRIQRVQNDNEIILARWVFDDDRVVSFHSVFEECYRSVLHLTDEEMRWGKAQLWEQAYMLREKYPSVTDWSVFEEGVETSSSCHPHHPHSSWWECFIHLKAELSAEEFDRLKRLRVDVPLSKRVEEYCAGWRL